MPKRRILLILFSVAAVAIAGLVMVPTREREPEYGGKKLSEWVAHLGSISSGSPQEEILAGLRNGGTNARPASAALVNLLVDRDSNLREAATNALRKIDPAALDKAKAR